MSMHTRSCEFLRAAFGAGGEARPRVLLRADLGGTPRAERWAWRIVVDAAAPFAKPQGVPPVRGGICQDRSEQRARHVDRSCLGADQ